MRVVLTNQLCDIVQAVHADELKHSGYKKVLDIIFSLRWIYVQYILLISPSVIVIVIHTVFIMCRARVL